MTDIAAAAPQQAVDRVRQHGPMTHNQIAARLNWSMSKATIAIRTARERSLLKIIGKDDYGRFIFAAVQTATWPVLP